MGSQGRPLLPGLWLVALVVAACATPPGSSPQTPASGGGEKPSGTSEPGGSPTGGPEVSAGPSKPSCSDGSCFECGEGICPSGFYCEKSGSAAPACAWAASCAQKPTCACLAAQTRGCTCQDRNGAPHVVCN
jgi:hypothetical protein